MALVADRQPPVTGKPRECALDDPAMPPQVPPVLDAPTRDAIGDPAFRERGAAGGVIVPLIGVQLGGTPGGAIRPHERWQRVEQRREDGAVVAVRPGQPRR